LGVPAAIAALASLTELPDLTIRREHSRELAAGYFVSGQAEPDF